MKKGFTLIELIVVIAIIAILAAIIAPNAFKAIEKGKISATISDLRALKTASMSYYADTGSWPADGTTETTSPNLFMTNGTGGAAVTGWDGPYLEKWPAKTAWGGDYSWQSDAAFDADAGVEQYISVTSISSAQFSKIDAQIDADPAASAATAGSVRLTGTTMRYLVAE